MTQKKSIGQQIEEFVSRDRTAKSKPAFTAREPSKLPDGTTGEQYKFIKFEMPYNARYDEGAYNEQEHIDRLLDEFVESYKPASYRIINAQIVYAGAWDGQINSMPPGILHVLHIGYQL